MVCIISESKEENRRHKEFCQKVADLGQDELTCLRFLRARNHDEDKAEDMLRKSVEWRRNNEVDRCNTWSISKEIIEGFPYQKPGLANDGHPVIYLPVGIWETRKFIEAGWKDEMMRKILVVLEDIIAQVRQSDVHQFYCIVDMNETTYHKVAHYETMQMILHVFRSFEANYPETLFKAVVINAPWVFSYIFPIIKPLISSHTMTKLSIYDANALKWRPALLEDMPENSLPDVKCTIAKTK